MRNQPITKTLCFYGEIWTFYIWLLFKTTLQQTMVLLLPLSNFRSFLVLNTKKAAQNKNNLNVKKTWKKDKEEVLWMQFSTSTGLKASLDDSMILQQQQRPQAKSTGLWLKRDVGKESLTVSDCFNDANKLCITSDGKCFAIDRKSACPCTW